MPTQNTTIVSDGSAKLTDAFKGTNVDTFLQSCLYSVQDFENTVWAVINAILNPTGDMLTRRARIVGEERNGRSDADLLAAFKLRVLVNKSQGRTEDLLKIASQLNPSRIFEGGAASWFIETSNLQSSPTTLASLLGIAKDGGAHGALSYSIWSPTLDFTWGDAAGGTSSGPGWGDSGGGYTGGLLYSLQGV